MLLSNSYCYEIILHWSRDTTIKMWDVIEQREVRNFGGHTGSVTSVVLLSDADSKAVGTYNYI